MKYITTTIALIAANYLYQSLSFKDWEVALERSYFQAVAILTIYLVNRT